MSENELPLVSVNMPCYNSSKYIQQSIDSILNQTYINFELIIVDDGSTDNSVEVIKSVRDSRVKLIENDVNQGIVYSRNRAIENSKGKYVAILDSDDIAYPTRLEKQVLFMESNPDFAMIGTWFDIIDENGVFDGEVIKFPLENKLIKTQLFFGNYFGQSTIMIKRELFHEFSYTKIYETAEDYFLWVQISEKYKVANLPESLVKYRVHKNNISQTKNEIQNKATRGIQTYQLKYLGLNGIVDNKIELHYKTLNFRYNLGSIAWQNYKEILDWILELQKRNSDIKVFDENYFTANLAEFWNYYFSWSYLQGLKAIPYLFKPFNSTITFKKRLRFILKCLKKEIKRIISTKIQ